MTNAPIIPAQRWGSKQGSTNALTFHTYIGIILTLTDSHPGCLRRRSFKPTNLAQRWAEDTMSNFFGWLTVTVFFLTIVWYAPLIVRRKVTPVPATWIVGATTLDVGAFAYLQIPGRPLMANVTLLAAAVEISMALTTVLYTLHRDGGLRQTRFDVVQKSVLCVTFFTLLYWGWSGGAHADKRGAQITFWVMQFLMITAYIPSVIRAYGLKRAFDSIGNWALIFSACVIGFVPAYAAPETARFYAVFNSWRGVVSSGVLLSFLLYFDKKNGWVGWRAEVASHREWLQRMGSRFSRRAVRA